MASTHHFHIVLEITVSAARQEQDRNCTQTGKETARGPYSQITRLSRQENLIDKATRSNNAVYQFQGREETRSILFLDTSNQQSESDISF